MYAQRCRVQRAVAGGPGVAGPHALGMCTAGSLCTMHSSNFGSVPLELITAFTSFCFQFTGLFSYWWGYTALRAALWPWQFWT